MPDPFISTIARPVPLDPVLEVSYTHRRYGDELHIKNINHAKTGLRDHIGKLSRIRLQNCLTDASVGHAAEIQPALVRGLIPIIAVDAPHQRESPGISHPSDVRITKDLLLRRCEN